MAGIKWDLRPSRLFEWLGDIRRRQIESGVKRVAERNAAKIEEWMRSNAVWQDRTGDARRELKAEIIDISGKAVTVLLRHGVDYGLWLEVANAGRYAILTKALDAWAPIIWSEVQMEITAGTVILDEGA
jgi:hypothetical protein